MHLAYLAAAQRAICVIEVEVDVRMAGTGGLQLLLLLGQRGIPWPVIMMTAHGDVAMAVHAMKLGAIAFLEKPFAASALEVILDSAFGTVDRLRQTLSACGDARVFVSRARV